MKKSFVTTVVAALVILLLTNGCASIAHNVYRQNQIRRSRVLASGNQEAIRAMSLGASPRDAMHGIQIRANNNEVAVMVDILDTSWVDAVKESPGWTTFWAVVDGATGYGLYLLGKELEGDDDNPATGTGGGVGVNIENSSDVRVTVVQGTENDSNADTEASGDSGSNDISR